MQQNIIIRTTVEKQVRLDQPLKQTTDYSEILREYGLSFRHINQYYQVGKIDWVQGWIIDISTVTLQIEHLLHAIIPYLRGENIAFKIARNAKKARSILGGEEGNLILGKVISIYPKNENHALEVAKC